MLRIDEAILNASDTICDNISKFNFSERGLLSQNLLGHLRNFVEYVAVKACYGTEDINPGEYTFIVEAIKNIKKRGELRFLNRFHELLQISVSHYTVDKDGSERLMLKYYEHLLKTKIYLKKEFNLEVLSNIQDFPINTDTELSEYYAKIAERIESPGPENYDVKYNDRYYVQKVKPFFINQKIYYEVTFSAAFGNISKFDRIIAFTQFEVPDNYAMKFSIRNDSIHILNKDMPILIIDNYEVSIRPCEWENFSKIFGLQDKYNTNSNEYRELMHFLSTNKISLSELVSAEQYYYDSVKDKVTEKAQSTKICELLDKCRNIIKVGKPGTNILRYLLHKMNNRVIKLQTGKNQCGDLSDLALNYKCIPFDKMPYCTSLRQHNPRLYDLFESIPAEGHEHELLARYIKNNTEIEGQLFTDKADIEGFDNINSLIEKYNNCLYFKHKNRKLEEFKNYIYVREYAEDSIKIIKKLQELASSGVPQYSASIDSWLLRESYYIDDDSKKETIRQMFTSSHVALIYGSAGTGKSTLIRHIANFWADKNKIFLANTHPAVDNMRRKVTASKSEFTTIAKFLSKKNYNTDADILFIDECSTVNNNDMRCVLEKARFKLLVLVGDVFQIESIYFGNWFTIAQKFLPKTSIFELTNPYRTKNKALLKIWNSVRTLDNDILELLIKNNYVAKLDESIFDHTEDDEIILCLNYDGLYGINNINRFLQNNNPNEAVIWGINTYKLGDPILFNESNIFSPLIHNNSKGKIVGIKTDEQQICFNIELDESINGIDANGYSFELIGVSDAGNSIISFSVNKYRSSDEDDDINDPRIVPFQVAYAVSIHKAQGLEYNSVKIVITNETEERITHNIFYTAITRAKEKLKIYWSPETEQFVLNHLKIKNSSRDSRLLAELPSSDLK